jgi:hypothetical protein
MWDEGDVLLHVDDFSDSDIVGGRRRRHRPVVPAEDARDGDRCRHGGDSLGSGRGYVGLKASWRWQWLAFGVRYKVRV